MELIPIIKTVITFFTVFSVVALTISYVMYKVKKNRKNKVQHNPVNSFNEINRLAEDSLAYANAGYEQSINRVPSNYEQFELSPVRNYKKSPVERFRVLNEQRENRREEYANVYGFAKTRQPIASSFKPQVAVVNSEKRENGIFGAYSNRLNEPLHKLNFSLTVR